MSALHSKVKEVGQSLLPVVVLVVILALAFIRVDFPVVRRFLIGSFLIFVGLSVFLWGVDQCMNPIGHYMASEVATSKGLFKAIALSFVLGFLITVAEPDLMILGEEVRSASGGSIGSRFLVVMVSIGVGFMIAFGALRILFDRPLNRMMTVVYGVILVLGVFTAEQFLAISFDASGATTGALTTPFVLALSVGLSRMKGGKSAEEDSFGLVGVMSAGPILAVMLMSIVTGQSGIQGTAETFEAGDQVLGPILGAMGPVFHESMLALFPIALLFFAYQRIKFKLPRREILGIVRGMIYTLIGLVLFLVGANQGFMEMGRILGMGIADLYRPALPLVGLAIGLIVVLAEPAVHVLGEQVEDVTAGQIPLKLIRLTLSIGVGAAIALSMVRIMVPEVKLWYFLLPGFAAAIVLSYFADPIFVGIAFDAGGVASGPMAATFVLSFAQGVADVIPTADVLADGFGVIAMIAMAPVLSIMILGALFKSKKKKAELRSSEYVRPERRLLPVSEIPMAAKDLVICVVNRGMADDLVALARKEGAGGATILHGRDARARAWASYSLELEAEKEILWFLVDAGMTRRLCELLLSQRKSQRAQDMLSVLAIPAGAAAGLRYFESADDEMKETAEAEGYDGQGA